MARVAVLNHGYREETAVLLDAAELARHDATALVLIPALTRRPWGFAWLAGHDPDALRAEADAAALATLRRMVDLVAPDLRAELAPPVRSSDRAVRASITSGCTALVLPSTSRLPRRRARHHAAQAHLRLIVVPVS